jgi:hypothetical protein
MATNDGTPPVPDPTILTTEQLLRTVRAERDYVDGIRDVIEERLAAMDKATALLSDTVNRVPTVVQTEVAHITGLMAERFTSIDNLMDVKFQSIATQFAERDTRQEREARDNKVAVDAAFAAQKEAAAKQDESNAKAIDKSERATAETISKLQDLTTTISNGLSAQIADLKSRLDSGEGRDSGSRTQETDNTAATVAAAAATRANITAVLSTLSVIVAIIALIVVHH